MNVNVQDLPELLSGEYKKRRARESQKLCILHMSIETNTANQDDINAGEDGLDDGVKKVSKGEVNDEGLRVNVKFGFLSRNSLELTVAVGEEVTVLNRDGLFVIVKVFLPSFLSSILFLLLFLLLLFNLIPVHIHFPVNDAGWLSLSNSVLSIPIYIYNLQMLYKYIYIHVYIYTRIYIYIYICVCVCDDDDDDDDLSLFNIVPIIRLRGLLTLLLPDLHPQILTISFYILYEIMLIFLSISVFIHINVYTRLLHCRIRMGWWVQFR